MADEKKPEAKPKIFALFGHPDPFVEIVWIFAVLLVLLFLVNGFISLVDSGVIPAFSKAFLYDYFISLFWKIYPYLKYIGILLTLLLIWFCFYLYGKIKHLRKTERDLLYPELVKQEQNVNPQWERILNHIETENENDWKLAIIEADIMLGGLLDNMLLPGDTIGDKLKAVEKSDFTTVDNAWEGHKIRNQIAHEGEKYVLNKREARRVIDLYRTVFEEFEIV
ncbi:MAG: hypothetical protein ABL899_03025 [Nitrospira sp.]